MAHFADELVTRVRNLGHPLCVGLDPHLSHIPEVFRRGEMKPQDPATAEAVADFLAAVVERLAGRVAIVKPQTAFFELLGWRGVRVLAEIVRRCREAELLVLLDAKRGDIGSTAEGYAAYLDPDGALPADAMTLSPYLGLDSLAPYVRRAREHARGLFVLVRTSNPGAGDYQDLDAGGAPLYEQVAKSLAPLSRTLRGQATGWSSLGVVVGATYPEQARRVREHLPRALFLIPGYGAQGASASQAMEGLRPGPAGREGGVVSSSRAILFPEHQASATSWERAFDDALGAAIDELGAAASR